MKKFIFIVLLALTACFACGCSCGSCKTEVPDIKEELIFNEYNVVLTLGESKRLSAEGDDLKWSSSNAEIVSVTDTGIIYALSIGNADITVTSGEQSKSITVYVVDFGIAKLETDFSDKYVKIGGTFKIEYVITLNGEKTSDTAKFESSDSSIATVTEDGVISGVSVGEADVKIKYTVSINGEICELLEQIKVYVTPSGILSLDRTEVNLVVKTLNGENEVSKQVNVIEKAVEGFESAEIVWSVENDKVAIVDNGLITSVAEGETVVIASINGNEDFSAKVNVTVGKEIVYLNESCFADMTTNTGSDDISEWAKLSIADGNFYGEITSVKNVNGITVENNGYYLKSDQIALGNNELIIETADFYYHANIKCGSSYYNFSEYALNPWESGKGSYEILDSFENKTNVLKAYSSAPKEGEVLDEETAETKYYDVYNNNVGKWNLSASNLFCNSGYIAFDLFVEKDSKAEVGFYVIYEKEGDLSENIIRFNSSLNRFLYSKNGKGLGVENSDIVKTADKDYKETQFKRGEWNTVLINLGMLDSAVYDSVSLVISFKNNSYVDGQQTAYYSDFKFIGEEQFYNITGNKTVCTVDKQVCLTSLIQADFYELTVENTSININDLVSVKYLNEKINVDKSNVCIIKGLVKDQVIELEIETDFKRYKVNAAVTVIVFNQNDNLIFDVGW